MKASQQEIDRVFDEILETVVQDFTGGWGEPLKDVDMRDLSSTEWRRVIKEAAKAIRSLKRGKTSG